MIWNKSWFGLWLVSILALQVPFICISYEKLGYKFAAMIGLAVLEISLLLLDCIACYSVKWNFLKLAINFLTTLLAFNIVVFLNTSAALSYSDIINTSGIHCKCTNCNYMYTGILYTFSLGLAINLSVKLKQSLYSFKTILNYSSIKKESQRDREESKINFEHVDMVYIPTQFTERPAKNPLKKHTVFKTTRMLSAELQEIEQQTLSKYNIN